jgi:chitin disaccharide deacetylase
MPIILNADDLGYEPNITRGIVQAMREGVVSSATYLVNGPFSAEAGPLAAGLSIGLHLNLARWQAVLDGTALSDASAATHSADWVAKETEAQFRRCGQLLGQTPTHLDVHRHLHRLPNVLSGVIAAASHLGLPVRSIDSAMRSALQGAGITTNDGFYGKADGPAFWTVPVFLSTLKQLPRSGVIELMCHPGYRPTAFSSGYGEQREVELATFVSAQARECGVAFVGWRHA